MKRIAFGFERLRTSAVRKAVLGAMRGFCTFSFSSVTASPEDAGLDGDLYQAYQARLGELGALDFDDLLTEGLKKDVTGLRCFRHLLVDEFQDINDVQYQLVRAWSRGGDLFVIGDPDQSIYGFRGASGRCFQRLCEDVPDVK